MANSRHIQFREYTSAQEVEAVIMAEAIPSRSGGGEVELASQRVENLFHVERRQRRLPEDGYVAAALGAQRGVRFM